MPFASENGGGFARLQGRLAAPGGGSVAGSSLPPLPGPAPAAPRVPVTPAAEPGTPGYSGAPNPFAQPEPPRVNPNFDTDAGVLQSKALEQLSRSQLDSALTQARNQLLAKYGDPALASMAGFGVDPQAAAFARQNYLSGNADLARLDRQRDQQRKAVVNALASHGLVFSGDLGYGLKNEEQNYGNARYDLTQQYLSQLADLLNNTLAQKNQLRQQTLGAYQQAYQNFLANPDVYLGAFGG